MPDRPSKSEAHDDGHREKLRGLLSAAMRRPLNAVRESCRPPLRLDRLGRTGLRLEQKHRRPALAPAGQTACHGSSVKDLLISGLNTRYLQAEVKDYRRSLGSERGQGTEAAVGRRLVDLVR